MNVSTLITFLRTPYLQPKLALMNDLKILSKLHFLYAAADAEVLKVLRTPATANAVAQQISAKRPDLLDALLDLGVAVGELSFQDGVFRLRGKRAIALAQEINDPFVAYLQEAVAYHGSVYIELTARIKGAPLGEYLDATADLIARSSRTLEPLVRGFVQQVIKARRPRRLLEIGCGSGVYLHHAADSDKDLTGVGIDMQEAAVQQARRNLQIWGLTDRFTIRHADIRANSRDLGGPFDLITLYNNLYYFPPEQRMALFAGIRPLLGPSGMLAIVSLMRGSSVSSRNFDVVLRSTKGCAALPDVRETMAQLREAGFSGVEEQTIMPSEHFAGVLARI
jgi:SAM-dependent methyltransferase